MGELRRIDQEFGTAAHYTSPPGGIFLWVTLPKSVNTTKLAELAAAESVAINPGVEWSLENTAQRQLRLCFANPDNATIREGVSKLAKICHQEFGLPEFAGNVRR